MPPKRPTPSKTSGSELKHQKEVMTLHEQAQLLDVFREGKSYAAVGRCYVVNESTIRYIKKNEVEIRTTVAVSFCECAKKITIVRNKHIVRMESALKLMISDCEKKNIPLGGNIICEKAQKLCQQIDRGGGAGGTEELQPRSSTAPGPEDFQTSKGWFDCF
ncbi:transposable element-derived 1-like [Octopus vulgaris]|uniref:Transposable element-derived 1-like n=1 Tax=Octopus vulgaris TaxID=6645 RepID=A0AA36F7A0_OCTVU|nr:transposable element-derived 1-like [Octopus vulgaris]